MKRLMCALVITLPACTVVFLTCNTTDPPPNEPDTTSHNFVWEVDTLGDGNSSALYDVTVINDTLAYAVGEIYLRDSAGQFDPNAYNAAKWNGASWELKRIPFIGPCSAVNYPPIRAIWAFSANSILVTNGGSIVRYDGTNAVMDCGMNSLLSGAINKIYANNPQNIYVVGNAGTIVYYNGTWLSLQSGTTVDIQDIWGATDPMSGALVILAVASFGPQVPQAKKLLRINPLTNAVTAINDSGLSTNLNGIWFEPGRKYYVSGAGLFSSVQLGEIWERDTTQPLIYKDAIRGNSVNDVMIAGSFGLVSHYNGSSWRHYMGNEVPSFYGAYYAVSFKGDFAVAVGWIDEKAVVLRGRRQ